MATVKVKQNELSPFFSLSLSLDFIILVNEEKRSLILQKKKKKKKNQKKKKKTKTNKKPPKILLNSLGLMVKFSVDLGVLIEKECLNNHLVYKEFTEMMILEGLY